MPPALLASLPGTTLPDRLSRAFSEVGFTVEPISLDGMAAEPGRADALGLLWVGADWDEGFRALERLPAETIRRNTVLVGPDPPLGCGPRIRRAGGLTFVRDPIPGWLTPILIETVARASRERPLAILGALRSLSEGVDENPMAVLKRIADVGGQLLHASRALAGVAPPEGGPLLVLVDGADGVVPQPWTRGAEEREPPGGLSELAVETREIIVVPDVAWSRVSQVVAGYAYYGAGVSVPVFASAEALVDPGAQLAATLNFYWIEPFLPTAGEMRILDVLSALASATLLRLYERRRLSNAHVASTAALAQLPRVFPLAVDRDVTLPGLSLGPRVGSGGLPRGQDAELRHFIRSTMRAQGACPQLQELWVRATPSSRAEPPWQSLGAPPDALRPPLTDEVLARASGEGAVEPVPVPGQPGRHAIVLPLGAPRVGSVVGVFPSRVAAAMAVGDLRSLAADLDLGVRMIRRAADSGAVVRLSRKVASDQDPAQLLHEMTELIRERMSADGCRVFVIRQSADGARVARIGHTTRQQPEMDLGPIREDRGLLDWVLTHDDWLCVNAARPADRTGMDPEMAISGRAGAVRVVARSRLLADAEATHGRGERVRLLAPLHSLERVAGVLEVWRNGDHPFDLDLDVASLLHFAPHVASACRRVLQMERARAELRAVATMTRALATATSLREMAEVLLAEVGTLAQAGNAVLLLHDPSRPGHLHYGGAWSEDPRQKALWATALGGLHQDCWADAGDWERQVAEVLPELLQTHGLGDFRLRDMQLLPQGVGAWPLGAVLFLDRPSDRRSYAPFAQDLSEHAAASLLQYAGTLLADQVRALTSRLVEQLGGVTDANASAEVVLQHTARLLAEATGASGGLVYIGEGHEWRTIFSMPHRDELAGFRVKPGSLTADSLQQGRVVRVLDVEDPRDPSQRRMDKEALAALRGAFGWRRARSWLCLPVVHEGRTVGLIKLLSHDAGPFLGSHAEELGRALATRAAWEVHKIRGREMLEDLNREGRTLAGLEGAALTQGLLAALETWASRYVRPDVRVVIIARTQERLMVEVGSAGVEPEHLARLEALSREIHGQSAQWKAGQERGGPWCGLAEPLSLPGDAELDGHLYFLHPQPFSAAARPVAQEAARETSLLLNGERLRVEWVFRAGLFRHAFVGPAQGLTSAARMLAHLALKGPVPEERARKLQVRVEQEAENIRLWRENYRLYMSSSVELRPRPGVLRKVIEQVVERYRPLMADRGLKLTLDWKAQGGLEFSFDPDALDLALSNLLDNATKYAFFNREVTVGVGTDARYVFVWVEDFGHPIPDRMKDDIYRIGRRIDWRDPLRPISGQGLGLPMARSVVEAHGGTLSHTCEPEGSGADAERSDRTPYRVRFTIKLPHNWGRRRS